MGRKRTKTKRRPAASPTPARRHPSAAPARWDRLGVWASAACAAHCVATPLLFLAAPAIASVWSHPAVHLLVAALVLPLAGTVLLRGYRRHRRRWVAGAALLGAGCILIGSCLPFLPTSDVAHAGPGSGGPGPAAHVHAHPPGHDECCPQVEVDPSGAVRVDWPLASVLTLLGSALLVFGHLGNLASIRCCQPVRSA
ncbi:MAG: MerC domain-containing protein [Planctomycetota bacterium]